MGKREFNLHIQGVIKIHYPRTPAFKLKLAKYIKTFLPNKGIGYKLNVKPLAAGQTMLAMIGYITKDQGLAHYTIITHNVTAQVV